MPRKKSTKAKEKTNWFSVRKIYHRAVQCLAVSWVYKMRRWIFFFVEGVNRALVVESKRKPSQSRFQDFNSDSLFSVSYISVYCSLGDLVLNQIILPRWYFSLFSSPVWFKIAFWDCEDIWCTPQSFLGIKVPREDWTPSQIRFCGWRLYQLWHREATIDGKLGLVGPYGAHFGWVPQHQKQIYENSQ